MKIKCRIRRLPDAWLKTVKQWKTAQPFFYNFNGYLIHRVDSALTFHDDNGNKRHSSVRYFCGNTGTTDDGEFYDNPPKDKLLCSTCERLAVNRGKPTASKLAGRHVHIGALYVKRICCQHKGSN